jgi:hypothetical protein
MKGKHRSLPEGKQNETAGASADSGVSEMHFSPVSALLPVLSVLLPLCRNCNTAFRRVQRLGFSFKPPVPVQSVVKGRCGFRAGNVLLELPVQKMQHFRLFRTYKREKHRTLGMR